MLPGVYGHDGVVERFARSLARGRLASTYLFVGPEGIGKRTFAVKLARALLCLGNGEVEMEACEACQSCQLIDAGNHPDLQVIVKPADKSSIPIETFIGDKDHRMREGLCRSIAFKPYLGGHKVAIIDDADFLSMEGANCLLKTLEEPPPRSVLILIGTSVGKQLPTIRSRCQIVRFAPLTTDVVARVLLERELVSGPDEAEQLAADSEGSLARVGELADPELKRFRQDLLARLAAVESDRVGLAKMVVEFVNQAGREAATRRNRLREVIGMTVSYYRRMMRCTSGIPGGPLDAEAADRHDDHTRRRNALTSVEQLDRCLWALVHVERNVNQTTLIECWLEDLGRIGSGQRMDAVLSSWV